MTAAEDTHKTHLKALLTRTSTTSLFNIQACASAFDPTSGCYWGGKADAWSNMTRTLGPLIGA